MDALRDIEAEILRPVHADELVGEDGDWIQNACLNWAADASELYIEGYYQAALRVVENLGHDQDFLVYPAIFLFRHYLELRLKHIIAMGEPMRRTLSRRLTTSPDSGAKRTGTSPASTRTAQTAKTSPPTSRRLAS